MALNQLYKRAIIYPSLISILLISIYSLITNYDYKSEWLDRKSSIILSVIFGIIYCTISSLLSSSIFLNHYDSIKKSNTLNFLTWFLLPIGFTLLIFTRDLQRRLEYNESSGCDFLFLIILNAPLVLGLVWTFMSQSSLYISK